MAKRQRVRLPEIFFEMLAQNSVVRERRKANLADKAAKKADIGARVAKLKKGER